MSWSYHFQWDRLFSLWLHFPWLGFFFTFFDSASHTRIYGQQASIHNGKWLDFFLQKSGSLRHLESTKSTINESEGQSGCFRRQQLISVHSQIMRTIEHQPQSRFYRNTFVTPPSPSLFTSRAMQHNRKLH